MDDGKGHFVEVAINTVSNLEAKMEMQRSMFHVGEEVTIKDSHFKIQRITPKKLILKLLPREEHNAIV